MADFRTSMPIQSNDISNSVKVSKNLNINAVDNTIYVELSDGTSSVHVTDSNLDVNLNSQTLGSIAVSANNNENSEVNPLFVQNVSSTLSGIDVIDFDESIDLISDASANHDYTITTGKTFKLHKIFGSASGAHKIELQAGAIASLATYGVAFASTANPNWEIDFKDIALEVPDTGTGTIRIIKTNNDAGSTVAGSEFSIYSTIIGTEV